MTARIFTGPFAETAASIMASLPWTVAKVTLRRCSCSTASFTVSGTSKNLMSANTFFPWASSQSTMSK